MEPKFTVRMEDGQIVIPPEVLEAAGVRPGDSVMLYRMGDELQIRKHEAGKEPVAAGQ